MNPSTQEAQDSFVPSLIKIDHVFPEKKKMKMWKVKDDDDADDIQRSILRYLCRNYDFSSRNYDFLPRNYCNNFLSRYYDFLSRNYDFWSNNYDFLSRYYDFKLIF